MILAIDVFLLLIAVFAVKSSLKLTDIGFFKGVRLRVDAWHSLLCMSVLKVG